MCSKDVYTISIIIPVYLLELNILIQIYYEITVSTLLLFLTHIKVKHKIDICNF